MIVYRLETDEGGGVYRASNLPVKSAGHRPTPCSDYFNGPYRGQYFGFASLDQMRAWFDEEGEVELMPLHNIAVSEYEVDEDYVTLGEHQCAFNRAMALRVARYSYSEVFYDREDTYVAEQAARSLAVPTPTCVPFVLD